MKPLIRKGFDVIFKENRCEIGKDRHIVAVAEERKGFILLSERKREKGIIVREDIGEKRRKQKNK